MPPESEFCGLSDGGKFKVATTIMNRITGVKWCVVWEFKMVAMETTGKISRVLFLKLISAKNTICPPNFMLVT